MEWTEKVHQAAQNERMENINRKKHQYSSHSKINKIPIHTNRFICTLSKMLMKPSKT